MRRYLHSFILSTLIYTTLFGSLLYFLEDIDFSRNTQEIQKETRIKIALANPQSQQKLKQTPKKTTQPITKKVTPKPKSKPKPQPKKIVKKRELPKEEIVKKKIIEPVEIEPKIENIQTAQKTEQELIITQTTPKKNLLQEQNRILKEQKEAEELAKKRNLFLSQLRDEINKNKTYPNSARRRNIQGEVKVKFQILPSGNVNNIEIIEGRSIFKKSIFSAIENSFPMKIDKTLFSFPKEFSVSVNYILK